MAYVERVEESFKQAGAELSGDPITNQAQDINKALVENAYTVISSTDGKFLAMEALDDQVIIVEDKFRTGFECKTCDGEQHIGEKCGICGGTGVETNSLSSEDRSAYPCRRCGNSGHKGFNPCSDCKGTGGLLIAPDIAKRRPTTGIVTSLGKKVAENGVIQVGNRVLYSLFAGSAIQFKQSICVRIMHEHEIMCKLHGSVKIGDSVR